MRLRAQLTRVDPRNLDQLPALRIRQPQLSWSSRREATPVLEDRRCAAQLPVKDLTRAKRWYSDMLGLKPFFEESEALHYRCGGETAFTLYASAAAGTSEQTVIAWLTQDIDAEIAELKKRGVTFESYDLPGVKTDENEVAQIGSDRVAWFKDSEGNVLAVGQSGAGLLERLDPGFSS